MKVPACRTCGENASSCPSPDLKLAVVADHVGGSSSLLVQYGRPALTVTASHKHEFFHFASESHWESVPTDGTYTSIAPRITMPTAVGSH